MYHELSRDYSTGSTPQHLSPNSRTPVDHKESAQSTYQLPDASAFSEELGKVASLPNFFSQERSRRSLRLVIAADFRNR